MSAAAAGGTFNIIRYDRFITRAYGTIRIFVVYPGIECVPI